MKVVIPEDLVVRSKLVGWTAALAALFVLGALLIPNAESGLVLITILFLSALTGALASSFVRYRARHRP